MSYIIIFFKEGCDKADKILEVKEKKGKLGSTKDTLMNKVDESPDLLNFVILTKKEALKLKKKLDEAIG